MGLWENEKRGGGGRGKKGKDRSKKERRGR